MKWFDVTTICYERYIDISNFLSFFPNENVYIFFHRMAWKEEALRKQDF